MLFHISFQEIAYIKKDLKFKFNPNLMLKFKKDMLRVVRFLIL